MPSADSKQSQSVPPGDENADFERAFFRVLRAMVFADPPRPELDALPLAQLRLLMTLHRMRDATMKEFSEQMQVSQSTVTQLADKLTRRGLAERHADEADRRVVRLRPSAEALEILDEAARERRETNHAIYAALSAVQRTETLRALETLGETAEAVRAAQGKPLPPLRPPGSGNASSRKNDGPELPQPVMDLMSRRVRGKAAK